MGNIKPIPRKIKMVGFDSDETILRCLEPHVFGLEQMVLVLADVTQIPYETIRDSIARVYERRGTTDYRRLIQEVDCFEKLYKGLSRESADQIRDELVEIGKKAFDINRDKYHQDIKGIKHLLKTLQDNNIFCFVLSNAPVYQVLRRIQRAGLEQYFRLICGCEDKISEVFPNYIKVLQSLGAFDGDYLLKTIKTPKPRTNLAELLEISPKEVREKVVIVGDSYSSDIQLALRNGCIGFHARYYVPESNIKTRLRRFSTPKLEAQFLEQEKSEKKNYIRAKEAEVFELHHPSELLEYLGLK